MNEIIFWFSNHKVRNYWLDKSIRCLEKHTVSIKYNRIESWIEFLNLKISFKVDFGKEWDCLAGNWDKNQYWVEELFDNIFEEFLFTFIFDNKPFEEIKEWLKFSFSDSLFKF